MTGPVLDVHQAADDQPCRRCGELIQRGRRLAVVAGLGAVHVACIPACPAGAVTAADQEPAEPVTSWSRVDAPGTDAAADPPGDSGQNVTSTPTPTTPRPDPAPVVDEDDRDPRRVPWWQW